MKLLEKFFTLSVPQITLHAIKLSFIVGSHHAFFSGINCLLPIVGLISGNTTFAISVAIHFLYSFFFAKKVLLTSFFGILTIMRLPTIIAGIYAMNQSRTLQVLIPFSCIILFFCHQEGNGAPFYTIYWFIPLLTALLPKNNILILRLINTTIIQHAVGSVIFLYRTNMAAAYWHTLIPVVAVERLLFACGMFIIVQIATQVNRLYNEFLLTKKSLLENHETISSKI